MVSWLLTAMLSLGSGVPLTCITQFSAQPRFRMDHNLTVYVHIGYPCFRLKG
jgi:hypothetical protein